MHSAIFIVHGHHPPTCFSTTIHLCLHYHWHPHDLSITKHALPLCCCSKCKKLSQGYSNNACHDRYDVQVNKCVMTHTRSQVDVPTCTFLILTNLLCSTGIASLQHRNHFRFLCLLLSTSSGVSLSFLGLYCSLLHRRHSSLYINTSNGLHNQSINLYLLTQQSTQITHRDISHYTYQIWQAEFYTVNLSVTQTIIHAKFGKVVIYAITYP